MLEDEIVLDKKFKHTIEVVVDRLVMKPDLRTRLAQSIETAISPRGRARRDRRPGRPGADVLREVRLPRARRRPARAPAAHLLVQLAARRVPALHGPRRAAGDRPRPARPRSDALDRRGRARPVVDRQLELLRGGHPGDRGQVGDRPRQAVAGADRRGAGSLPVRHRRRPDLRPLPQPDGAAALVHARLRGDRQEPRAALPRDGLVTAARADRGVHELPALPAVRRRAAQARGARGHDRREEHPRVLEDVRHAGDRVPRLARADARPRS